MAAFAQNGNLFAYEQDLPALDDRSAAVVAAERTGFVGEDHLARFILALVLEPLDLGEIEAAYASERGQPRLTRR